MKNHIKLDKENSAALSTAADTEQREQALEFYRHALMDEDLPESYKQMIRIFLLDPQGNTYEEALDLMSIDGQDLLPAPVFAWLCAFFKSEAKWNPDAWNDLGVLYYMGRSGTCDFAAARECYEKGAEEGSVQCAENLGYLYRYGQGARQNMEMAWQLFAKGALAGLPASMVQLARMMESGLGFPKDLMMAARLYQRIYEECDPDDDPSLWSAAACGLGRIVLQHPQKMRVLMHESSSQLFKAALSCARDLITAENDPILFEELHSAALILEQNLGRDLFPQFSHPERWKKQNSMHADGADDPEDEISVDFSTLLA